MKKILIFEPNSNQALAISRYIKKYSDLYIVGCLEKEMRFNSTNYDEIIVSSFLDINIAEYLYILPMGANSSYRIIDEYKELDYCNNLKFDIKNLIVFDKVKMLSIVKNIGIPTPKTFYQMQEIEMFPIFYKENFENGGGIRGVANNIEEIPTYDKLLYQEFINTPSTYAVGFLAQNGKILTYTIHKEIISYPLSGGSSVVIESFDDKRLLKYTSKIIHKLNYNGWGLAEYKYCNKRDDFVFMEINAKFWASIEFMLKNNPLFLKNLLDIEYTQESIKRILFINRLFQYDFIDIIKNIKYYFTSHVIKESSLLYQVLRKFIPQKIVDLIKKLIK